MDVKNYKNLTASFTSTLEESYKQTLSQPGWEDLRSALDVANDAIKTEFERIVINNCIRRAVEKALAKGDEWNEYPGTEEEAIDFGEGDYNFSFTLLCTYRIDDKIPLSLENSQMYNALNNIPIDTFYGYIGLTRFELPVDDDDVKYFFEMVEKYRSNTMTKMEAIKFIHKYTSDNKFHEFLTTGKVERDEDI